MTVLLTCVNTEAPALIRSTTTCAHVQLDTLERTVVLVRRAFLFIKTESALEKSTEPVVSAKPAYLLVCV